MTDEDGSLLNNQQAETGERSCARNVSFARQIENALAPVEPSPHNVRLTGPLVISAHTCCVSLMRDGYHSRAPVCAYEHVPPRHRHCARSDGYLKPSDSIGSPTDPVTIPTHPAQL